MTSYILHICFLGWLQACNSVRNIHFDSEEACLKVMVVTEAQIKATGKEYIAYCKKAEGKR